MAFQCFNSGGFEDNFLFRGFGFLTDNQLNKKKSILPLAI